MAGKRTTYTFLTNSLIDQGPALTTAQQDSVQQTERTVLSRTMYLVFLLYTVFCIIVMLSTVNENNSKDIHGALLLLSVAMPCCIYVSFQIIRYARFVSTGREILYSDIAFTFETSIMDTLMVTACMVIICLLGFFSSIMIIKSTILLLGAHWGFLLIPLWIFGILIFYMYSVLTGKRNQKLLMTQHALEGDYNER